MENIRRPIRSPHHRLKRLFLVVCGRLCGGVTGFVGNLSNGLILIVAEEEDDPLAMSFANGRQRRSEGKSSIP
ncbi:MAG TPA: hypothetical protein PLV96_05635, partial [Methanoregulaceae archaeon]|nr:hypothetical protein [Methanoregulaceae archaeon]